MKETRIRPDWILKGYCGMKLFVRAPFKDILLKRKLVTITDKFEMTLKKNWNK